MNIIATARGNQSREHLTDNPGVGNAKHLKRVDLECDRAGNRLHEAGDVGHLNTQEIADALQLVQ